MTYWPEDQIICADTDELRSTPEGEEAWKEARRHGIGGSEAAAVCGVADYGSAYDVWSEKVGLPRPPFEVTEPIHWGNVLEPVLAGEFAARKKDTLVVEHCPVMLRSREFPWMLSNPDKVLWDADNRLGVLEIKTTSLRLEHEWKDSAPKSAAVQAVHNAIVMGASFAWVCCLIGGQKFVMEEVELDPAIVNEVIGRERRFWHHNVLDGNAPQKAGSDADLMRKQWPDATDQYADLPQEARDWIGAYLHYRAEEKAAKESKKAAQAELQFHMKDAAFATFEDELAVTWKQAVDGTRRFNVTAAGRKLT